MKNLFVLCFYVLISIRVLFVFIYVLSERSEEKEHIFRKPFIPLYAEKDEEECFCSAFRIASIAREKR